MSAAPRLEVRFVPRELAPGELGGRIAVVVDAIRATTSIVHALAAGARGVVPAATPGDAVRIAERLGRPSALLCGERQGVRIDGFELGNSPAEFTPERVAGRTLVMTTTNGTAALLASAGAVRTLVGAFVNVSAVADAVHAADADAVVVCAGREGRFALEDALFAGALALRVRALRGGRLATDDAGFAAMALAQRFAERLPLVLGNTEAGRRLMRIGLVADLEACARTDALPLVAELRERMVTRVDAAPARVVGA